MPYKEDNCWKAASSLLENSLGNCTAVLMLLVSLPCVSHFISNSDNAFILSPASLLPLSHWSIWGRTWELIMIFTCSQLIGRQWCSETKSWIFVFIPVSTPLSFRISQREIKFMRTLFHRNFGFTLNVQELNYIFLLAEHGLSWGRIKINSYQLIV